MVAIKEKTLREIINTVLSRERPKRIIVFGSRARGDNKKTSDIDLAIEGASNIGIIKELLDENVTTLLKFDVVDLDRVDPEFKERILKEGVVVYESE